MSVKGKVMFITGGSAGIGKGICLAYAKEGASIVFVGRNEERGKNTEKELQDIGCDATFMQGDVSDLASLPKLIEKTIEKYGKLDILINNASGGGGVDNLFEETSNEDMMESLTGGFMPTFILMREALPYLRETKGSIINFASNSGMIGLAKKTAYAAAKESIRAISRVATNEWGRYGININNIAPIAATPGVESWKEEDPEAYQKMTSLIPLRRLGDPEKDIGRTAVFLGSDDANYITGQTFMVDGGNLMLR